MANKYVPFTETHLDSAVALFAAAYQREQQHSPLLPNRAIDDSDWIRGLLQGNLGNPSVAVIEDGKLLAYMLTGPQFAWKGQRCALVPEFAHASVEARKAVLYQRMYRTMAEQWVANGMHIHLIGHLAHDAVLKDTLFQLGYGAILAERLRDLSSIEASGDIKVVQIKDAEALVDLEFEHNGYYPQSPIFLGKGVDKQQVRKDLEESFSAGKVHFAVYDGDKPVAYTIVGESGADGEGLLLRKTNSAQLKSMYAQPACRGQGIGAALLQAAITWARENGYDRLMVEHETANIFGGNFWRKHFEQYVYFSMRYVDNTL